MEKRNLKGKKMKKKCGSLNASGFARILIVSCMFLLFSASHAASENKHDTRDKMLKGPEKYELRIGSYQSVISIT